MAVFHTRPRALQVFAGPRALLHLRERGLRPADVRVIPAAAGGPKGLVLNPLDRFLFGHWLAGSSVWAPTTRTWLEPWPTWHSQTFAKRSTPSPRIAAASA